MKVLVRSLFAAIALLSWSGALLTASHLSAQAPVVTITGRIVNGTANAPFDASRVPVTLNILEGVTPVDQRSVTPGDGGSFQFSVTPQPERTYFITAEYQGAVYSVSRSGASLTEPITLTVFERTEDPGVLAVEGYTIIITGAVPDERFIEVLERAQVRNASDRTLVPNLAGQGPAMLSFLRFALPPNATNLNVESTLVGGDVLEVDRGFAVTTPIPPTGEQPHLFQFVYRLPYEAASLDLSRTMRFGAATIRVVVPEEVASVTAPQLTDLGATPFEGRELRLLEGPSLPPGEVLVLRLDGLPQPSLLNRLTRNTARAYVTLVAPALVSAALIALLAFGFVKGRKVRGAHQLAADPEALRTRTREQLADLETSYAEGNLTRRQYLRERERIRDLLITLAQEERYRQETTPR